MQLDSERQLHGWVVFNPVESLAYVIDFVIGGVAFVTELGDPGIYYAIPLGELRVGSEWFHLFPSVKHYEDREDRA